VFPKQAACNLQAHRSPDNCLAGYLYNDGVVQAVTFAYLIYQARTSKSALSLQICMRQLQL